MLYTETIENRGRLFKRTYSDRYRIVRDGMEYDEAVDPMDSERTYTESETLLDAQELI